MRHLGRLVAEVVQSIAMAVCPGVTLRGLDGGAESLTLEKGVLPEPPQIPNYSDGASTFRLRKGMAICTEPMINQSSAKIKILPDRWTVVTLVGGLSAHFEHALAITEGAAETRTEWNLVPAYSGMKPNKRA
jgi:methionine aminopeptidase